jgi:3-hydroxy-3-methylglutaryl CoA synthase
MYHPMVSVICGTLILSLFCLLSHSTSHDPIFVYSYLVGAISVFKSYPVVADSAFAMALLACNAPLLSRASLSLSLLYFYFHFFHFL